MNKRATVNPQALSQEMNFHFQDESAWVEDGATESVADAFNFACRDPSCRLEGEDGKLR